MCRFPDENMGGLGPSSPNTSLKTKVLQVPPLKLTWGWSLQRLDSKERFTEAGHMAINSDTTRKESGVVEVQESRTGGTDKRKVSGANEQ